jgi:hypothetical protein
MASHLYGVGEADLALRVAASLRRHSPSVAVPPARKQEWADSVEMAVFNDHPVTDIARPARGGRR